MNASELDIESYEAVIQATGDEIESHLRQLFFDDANGFDEGFDPVKSWDDAWRFVTYFDVTAHWREGHRFYIYLSLLSRHEVTSEFKLKLSRLTRTNLCKAAVLAKTDPLKFADDSQQVIRDAQKDVPKKTLGIDFATHRFTAALQAISVRREGSPYLQRINERIRMLDDEERRWRVDQGIPL